MHYIVHTRPDNTTEVAQAKKYLKDVFGLPLTFTTSNGGTKVIDVDIVDDYVMHGRTMGVNWLYALGQAIVETGGFHFGGVVKPEQNNFCGLGATSASNPGCSFATQSDGVLAHLQHLFAYGCTDPLPTGVKLVDPRFQYVKRGCAPFVEWLGHVDNPYGYGWAYPGDGYGAEILSHVHAIQTLAL